MPARKKSRPQELITFLCTRCQWDFARTELDSPVCTLCEKSDQLQELKREPVTPQALEAGMMRSIDRMMTGLRGAYDTGKQQGIGDNEEILLLETMVKAKNLEQELQKAFGNKKMKRPHIHGISMTL